MPALNESTYLWLLADHLEIEHEREMPGHWTFKELTKAHKALHRTSNSDHNHD